jgi:hypothetical protein
MKIQLFPNLQATVDNISIEMPWIKIGVIKIRKISEYQIIGECV